MSTQFTNRQWRLPNNENKDKQSNYSMVFDGSSQYISLSTDIFDFGSNAFSFSGWVKRTSIGDSTNVILFIQKSGTTPTMQIRQNARNIKVDFNVGSTWSFVETTTNPIGNDTNWHHLAVTKSGTSMSIYFDGVLQDTGTAPATLDAGNDSVFIGSRGALSQFWNGSIDAVSIYNYALSSSQITTLYGSSSTGIGNPMSLSPKPVAYYQLGDKSAFNGSNYLVPNIAAQEDDGDIAVSYSPYALDFDGTNDYIDCGNDSSLSFSTSFSLSVWINNWSNDGNCVAMKGDGASYGYFLFAPHPSDLNKFKVWIKTSNNWYNASNDIGFSDNTKWVNLVVCYNSIDNSLVLYSNGVSGSVTTTAGTLLTGTQNFKFGVENNTTSFYNGSISNASIWNTALTSAQVSEIYNEGVPSNLNNHSAYSNLVSWWQLGSNTSWVDPYWIALDEKGTNNGQSQNVAAPNNMGESAIVDGVGSYANGLGTSGLEVVGDAFGSSANSLSYNMDVLDRSTDVPN